MSALNNARWVAVSQAARVVMQLAGLAILSRLLTPTDFGLIAMATVITNFAMVIRDLGTAAALIQKKDLHEDTINTVFWLNVGVGTVMALLLVVCSTLIADAFNAQELIGVVLALALAFPVASFASAHQALIERESRFRVLARVEILSTFIGLMLAIASAWLGAGVYSLVLQTLATVLLSSIMLWLASGWRPRFVWSQREFRGLVNFSGNLSASSIVHYISTNVDSMLIGRFLGAASLGVYSLAYKVMQFPLLSMTLVASRALYPIMSKQQDSIAEMSRLYLRAVTFIAFATAPVLAGLFVLREPFVLAIFGEKWSDMAPVLAWLAPAGFIQAIAATKAPVLLARGRADILLRIGIVNTVVLVAAIQFGINWGIVGVAVGYLAASIVNGVQSLLATVRQLDAQLSKLLLRLGKPVAMSVVMALVVHFGEDALLSVVQRPIDKLLIMIPLGAVVYLALALLFARDDIQNMIRVFRRG